MINKRDVIKIVDQDILDAMAYTLWKMSYQETIDYMTKEYDDFVDEFIDFVISPAKEYKILCFDEQEGQHNYHFRLMCERLNNFRHTKYITDLFLVSEVHDDHFKVTLLNEFDVKEFYRLGKLTEIMRFLDSLEFPYRDEQKTFYKMGTGFKEE